VAAGFGSEFCLPYLLTNGADVHATDAVPPCLTGWSSFSQNRIALHESAHNGTLSIFKLLLQAGSDKDALDDVFFSFFMFFSEFIKFVLQCPNSPLHFAAFAGNFLIVEHLLFMGVDLKSQTIDHVS
jgi:ankyrin repeat protein